jgi:hypothetical protein
MPGIHIDRWSAGLITNRSAISMQAHDALIDGLNVEITPSNSLARRPGWTKYCSAAFNGGGDVANGLSGCNLNSAIHVLLSTDKAVYDVGTSSVTSLFTKGTSLQTFFQQVGNYVFFSDGTNNKKWSGQVITGGGVDVTNNGVVAPTLAPTIPNLNLYDTVGASQTLHAWVPNAVYSNTTGAAQNYFFLAPSGEVQWAVVPAGSKLQSQSSAPNWATNFGLFGNTTVDGTMSWINCGPITSWAGLTIFANGAFYINKVLTSGAPVTTFTTTGSVSPAANNWDVSLTTEARVFGANSNTGNSNTLIATGFGLSIPAGATVKGVVVTLAKGANRTNVISDVTVKLLKAGVAAGSNKAQAGFWPNTGDHDHFPSPSQVTKVQYGSSSDMWGTTIVPADVASSGFGFEVILNVNNGDWGGAVLANAACSITVYYTVAVGDIAGSIYAQIIQDSNGNLQRVKTSGTSAAGVPTWSTTIGGTTADGTITWECLGTGSHLPVLFNWTYAYGFHTGSAHISTLSPTLQVVAPAIGTGVNLQGFGSSDTQVDRNDVYRTPDGGSLLLFNQSTTNVNAATTWTVSDSTLDNDLNFEIIGPIRHANDPPPAGMTILAYHIGRLWGLVGNLLYFSAGPDCTNGDGNQAWPPANVFTLTAPGTALAPTTQGLVVFTGIDVSAVLGGPQLNTFWLQPLFKNLGVQSPNCLTQEGDELVLFTSQQQAIIISTKGKDEFGFRVSPTLATNFPAATSYIASHRAGQDQGVFLSNGSTTQMRFNLNTEGWDPKGTPVNGIGPLASLDTAIGTRRLLSTAGGFVVFRDVTTFSDAGSAYAQPYATVGSLVLSQAGEKVLARVDGFILQSAAVGTALAVLTLPNEISGSFTNIPLTHNDPPQLPASATINQKTYRWLGVQSALPNGIRHLQVKITMPSADTVKNEIFTLSLV